MASDDRHLAGCVARDKPGCPTKAVGFSRVHHEQRSLDHLGMVFPSLCAGGPPGRPVLDQLAWYRGAANFVIELISVQFSRRQLSRLRAK